jgi:Kelch motif
VVRKLIGMLGAAAMVGAALGTAHAGTWTPVTNPAPFNPGTPLLLMNGDVMVQDSGPNGAGSPEWWLLEPSTSGSYVNGTWHQIASLPVIKGTQYQPQYFASAVLPDGKVLIMGGEYNGGGEVFTNLGAIYNPSTNKWTPVNPPSDSNGVWPQIGDAASVVLPNGTFMLQRGPCLSACPGAETALFNEAKLSWTVVPGTGMLVDYQDEQGYTLLRDGTVLTVDVWGADASPPDPKHAEKFIYNSTSPTTSKWVSAGDTTAQLDGNVYECKTKPVKYCNAAEIGPAVLRADGTVIAFGATGFNSIYHPPTTPTQPGTWSKAPTFPSINEAPCTDGKAYYDVADGPAALLPSGNVLVAASPGVYCNPTHFYELNAAGTVLTPEPATQFAPNEPSYVGRMLELPTGQILYTDGNEVEIYAPSGAPEAAWVPTITSISSTSITQGDDYTISGTQFNGLSQGGMYGDDVQLATNYPLVRLSYTGGKVYYCRTFNPSTMAVATGSKTVSASFTCPTNIPTGAAKLEVVANGIPSAAKDVTIH